MNVTGGSMMNQDPNSLECKIKNNMIQGCVLSTTNLTLFNVSMLSRVVNIVREITDS